MSFNRTLSSAAAAAVIAPACLGQSNVSTQHKNAWSENCGWTNWRDAGSPAGARLSPSGRFFSGYVWGENIGWINLGGGQPANGLAYANTTGADSGVNLDPATGRLSGMAWGENVGWISFDAGATKGESFAARIDTVAPRRFRGYAWGENIGWLNLDDAANYVEVRPCAADFNGSGLVSVQDIFDFLAAYFSGDPAADFNGSGLVSVQDIFDFLAAYFAGCP